MSKYKALLGALAVCAAVPAAAAPRGYYAPSYAPATNNALRLEIGGASLSSPGVYCPNGPRGGCVDDGPFGWGSLSLGGAIDIGLGNSPVAFTIAAHELAASDYSGAPNIFEPSFGLTFRFLRYQQTQFRLGVGVGLLLADTGDTGASPWSAWTTTTVSGRSSSASRRGASSRSVYSISAW